MTKIFIPYVPDRRTLWRVCLVILISTFFILFFLQPFGDITHGYTLSGFLRVLSYSLVASGSVFLLENFSAKYYKAKWRISQTRYGPLVWYFLVLLFVTINIFLCRASWMGWSETSWIDLGVVLYRVSIISIIPFSLIAFILLLQKSQIGDLELKLSSKDINPEHLKLNLSELIYITSEENYSSIFISKEEKVERKLLRGSLTFFEEQVQSPVIRVHRSYLVNLLQVMEVKMNSSGGSIRLKGIDPVIPISRKHLTAFQNHWSQMH